MLGHPLPQYKPPHLWSTAVERDKVVKTRSLPCSPSYVPWLVSFTPPWLAPQAAVAPLVASHPSLAGVTHSLVTGRPPHAPLG